MQNIFHYWLYGNRKKYSFTNYFKTHLEEEQKKEDVIIDSISYPLSVSVEEDTSIERKWFHRRRYTSKYFLIEDLDSYILNKIDRSISEYFSEEGEECLS